MEVKKTDKITKIKLLVFSSITVIAVASYIFRILPRIAIWLWPPVLALVDYYIDWYAQRRGIILYDEMVERTTEKSAWITFQVTILLMFLIIVQFDIYRTQIDPRYIVAYLAGFMGILFLAINTYYNIKQGALE